MQTPHWTAMRIPTIYPSVQTQGSTWSWVTSARFLLQTISPWPILLLSPQPSKRPLSKTFPHQNSDAFLVPSTYLQPSQLPKYEYRLEHHSTDHRTHEGISELNACSAKKKLAQYKQKWLKWGAWKTVDIPKQLLGYRPIWRRRPGRSLNSNGQIQSWGRNRSFTSNYVTCIKSDLLRYVTSKIAHLICWVTTLIPRNACFQTLRDSRSSTEIRN